MVAPVSPQMAPPAIANAQILDYVDRTPNAAINLVTALAAAQPSLPRPRATATSAARADVVHEHLSRAGSTSGASASSSSRLC